MERGALVVMNVLGLVAMASLSACNSPVAGMAATEPGYPPIEKRARVPDEYLVTLIPDADRNAIAERFGTLGIKQVYFLEGETFLLILSNDPGPQKMEELISGDARIRSVHPNLVYWTNRSGSLH